MIKTEVMTPEQKKSVEEAKETYWQKEDGIAAIDFHAGMQEILSNPSKYGLQPKTEWVSVGDRLPEGPEEVLIYAGADIVQAYLDDGYWWGSRICTDNMNDGWVRDRLMCKQGSHFDFVTHWMPLPKPPTETK